MAASKKDMRRTDLIIPYQEPESDSKDTDMGSTLATTMPMMAMFTRNKMIGWAAFVFSIQQWMGETREMRKKSSTPSYFAVLMSFLGLASTYLTLFLPPAHLRAGTGTEAQPPQPAP